MRSTTSKTPFVCLVTALFVVFAPTAWAQPSPVVHHDLAVTIDPAMHRLQARDRIHVPGALVTQGFTISLNADLNVRLVSAGLSLVPVRSRVAGADSGMDREDRAARVSVNVYRVEGAVPGQDFTGEFVYHGVIDHPVRAATGEY